MDTPDLTWLQQFIRHDDYAAIGAQSAVRTALRRGQLTRLARGVYLPTTFVSGWDGDARFRALVHATSSRHPGEVFSHFSAAALWRLPNLDHWPARPEAVIDASPGGRSPAGLHRRAVGRPQQPANVDGVMVTDLARTVVDLASSAAFSQAVAFADSALSGLSEAGVVRAGISKQALHEQLALRGSRRGATRCGIVIDFADAASGSPGESLSRVAMQMLGFPAPCLQAPFSDAQGLIGTVDFWWPDFGVIGEFDGVGKYLRAELRGGRSVAQVVVDEKRREDRLRAVPGVRTVVRWGWSDARSLRGLESGLRAAGLPQRRSSRSAL